MTQLNRNDITNLYLYGDKTTPTNLVDSSLIRPEDTVTEVLVDVEDFMQTGAGRFAVGSQFELIQRFFDPGLFTPSISSGTYSKNEVANLLGLTSFDWSMQQFNYEDSVDDYIDRTWIYNSMEFQISDYAEFVVEENGDKLIKNFAVYPRTDIQENFDFATNDIPTALLNVAASIAVDPSEIGRRVNINFSNPSSITRTTYEEQDFLNDF